MLTNLLLFLLAAELGYLCRTARHLRREMVERASSIAAAAALIANAPPPKLAPKHRERKRRRLAGAS